MEELLSQVQKLVSSVVDNRQANNSATTPCSKLATSGDNDAAVLKNYGANGGFNRCRSTNVLVQNHQLAANCGQSSSFVGENNHHN